MKKLYLLRHAKSSWNYPELDDFERPLNKRGHADLPIMGRILKQLNVKPDLILSSPASRAAMTARILFQYLHSANLDLMYESSIYEADPSTLMQILKNLPDEKKSVILVGHNPALTFLANMLADHQVSNIPTAGCFAIDLDISGWSKLRDRSGHNVFFEYPKKYHNE